MMPNNRRQSASNSMNIVVKITTISLCAVLTCFGSNFVLAKSSTPTASQLETISNSCASLRQSLKTLQRTDARARTYFGAIYETLSSKYFVPLNLRLVKNNLSSVSLINLQTNFSSTKATFSADYIDYARSLEELSNIDCRLEPEHFYEQLLATREKRTKVSEDLQKMNSLAISSVPLIEKLQESIQNE